MAIRDARSTLPPYRPPNGSEYNPVWKRLVVPVPEELDLNSHRSATLSIADACRHAVFVSRSPLGLDFSRTKRISPAAALYLAAEIYRCRKAGQKNLLSGTYPADSKVHRQMQDCGFFDILEIKNKLPDEPKTYPLEYIKVMTGQGAVGELADSLQKMLLGPEVMNAAAYKAFYRGVSEAMTNVAQHADPEVPDGSRYKRMLKRWWMLGHVNKLRQELKIMIVDQGIGIPRSLPLKYPLEFINNVLSKLGLAKPTDGEMIEAAMAVGRTKTYRPHQGKGLNDLKLFVDMAGQGARLRILSNRGEYLYTVSGKNGPSVHPDSIKGTFIEWTIPLAAIQKMVAEEMK